MERRDIIEQTIANMENIYSDVSRIAQLIEEKMKNWGFEAFGDAAFTWEVSVAFNNYKWWLYKYFARTYLNQKNPQDTVGFCIHLGGYQQDWVKKLAEFSVSLPVMSVSFLKMDREVKKLARKDILECLWCGGWYDTYVKLQKILNKRVVYGIVDDQEIKAKILTYFVDFLSLTSEDLVEQLVAEPMARMFDGDEEWIVKLNLQVVQIDKILKG